MEFLEITAVSLQPDLFSCETPKPKLSSHPGDAADEAAGYTPLKVY
ncbi:MAG: hypothetical protein ACOYWZ_17060 [Bacillota bacterium]